MNTRLISIAALISATLTLTACGNAGANNGKQQAQAEERGVPVETILVDRGTVRASFQASAILEAEESTDVVPRVSGIIEEIFVEEGDFVEQGQALARLESSRYSLARDQIAAELRNVKQELTRHHQLAERQMVSAEAVERLQSRKDALTAQLEIAEIDLRETVIRAPISGHISQRYARTGNLIQAWQPKTLFHVVDSSVLRATVNLPEHAIVHIQTGQSAEIRLPAMPEFGTVTASVARISPVIDSASGTFRVVLAVPNTDYRLRAGMFSRVNVHYAERQNVVRIPQDALIRVDNQSHVFTVSEGLAQRIEVSTGLREAGWIEIIQGLDEGHSLIITGHNNLRDAAKVEEIKL
ncbi:MAG: efflux RND transporter periplasmic adaptor subunit [Idiomarina sp.]|nr:efflux RND transporter periplasmic adaptor subunit [Idiomarina sp.]